MNLASSREKTMPRTMNPVLFVCTKLPGIACHVSKQTADESIGAEATGWAMNDLKKRVSN